MAGYSEAMSNEPKTARGRATRERIVERAAELIAGHGVEGTSLDEVLVSAAVSKSQLYHYFADRDELVEAAVKHRCELVLGELTGMLGAVESFAELRRALDGFVAVYEQRMSGCPIGTLANEVADRNEGARLQVAAAFDSWEGLFAAGLARMRERGELRADASPQALATFLLASLEGGLLLSHTRRSGASLRIAMDSALSAVEAFRA